MTEAPDAYPDFPDHDDPGESDAEAGDSVEGTGDPRVDDVLRSLDGLEERPVDEHAEVFERAHDELRAALEPGRESA